MEQSPSWEAYSCSGRQEIFCTLWYPKAHYCIRKGPWPGPDQSRLQLIFSISILNCFPICSWVFQLVSFTQVPHQNPVCTSLSLPYLTHDLPISCLLIWWRIKIMKLPTVQFSPAPCCFVLLWPKCLPQHPILKHPRTAFFLLLDRSYIKQKAKLQFSIY